MREGGQTMCPCVLQRTGHILRFTLSVAVHLEDRVGQPLIRRALGGATQSVLVGRGKVHQYVWGEGWTRDDTEITGVLQPQYLVVARGDNPSCVRENMY